MVIAAEQKIFDWHSANGGYSGEMVEQVTGVRKLTEDISASVERSSYGQSSDEPLTSFSFVEQKIATSTLLSRQDEPLDVSSFSERVVLRPQKLTGSALAPIREWEGSVEQIGNESFFVKLCDVKDPSGVPTDEAEFELRDLTEADRKNLRVGSIVRWVIGYERLPTDQRQKVSRIHVRRLPVFTASDIESAYTAADDLLAGFLIDGKK